jgi:Carboxypeptidase regulatory-like domain
MLRGLARNSVVPSSLVHKLVSVKVVICLLIATSILTWVAVASAQAPVGTISGTVTDANGEAVASAVVIVKAKGTGAERRLTTAADGTFAAPALPAGQYEVTTQAQGFRTLIHEVTVATGSVVTVEMQLEVGQTTEVVTVQGAEAQINYETHSIDGVITRQKIQDLPLNGRSFLQLAFLEPGVSVSPGTTSQYNSLFSVSVLGGDSNKTAITVDGGNVRNSIEGQTGMNFSQEVIQEFQLSAANFNLSTGITSVGAVNIVTRGGTNQFHGSGYFFFRDHNMAAYPGLVHNPFSPDPFFARRNPGVWVGGPIKKDRLFFFANYEYTSQTQVFTVQPDLPSVRGLAGNFGSPYHGHLFSVRIDWKATDKHTAFLRYSHDKNSGFGPNSGAPLPSNWLQNRNFSDQGVLGVTSTLKPTLVNDFRFNFTYWQNRNLFADDNLCPGCLGLGFPNLTLVGSSNFAVGNTTNATQGRDLRRFTFLDTLTWQKSSHRLAFGTELEYAPGTGFWGYCDPGCAVAFSPESVKALLPAAALAAFFPKLPSVISTNADLLNLPFAGAVVGVGDPGQPPPYNIDKAKANNRYRIFAEDTWHVAPRLNLNLGLAWSFESTLVNRDLSKPAYLAPIYGSDLSPTNNNYHNFSPSLGFAWSVDKSNKTVIRGGAGIYYDTELLWRRLQERAFIGPVGNGRIQFPSTGFKNTFPGIFNFNDIDPKTGLPRTVPVGANLPSNALTTLTLGQYMQIVQQQIPAVNAALAPKNPDDLSVRNIQINKAGAQLYPTDYPVQRSYQMGIGVQRELRHDMVLSADFVRRVFVNTLIGEEDLNRFNRRINGVQTPVIPRCVGTQQADPNAQCSTGPITFWQPGGRGTYTGLLVKLDKRFSNRFLFTASYALQSQRGLGTIYNLDNYFQSYGPSGSHHIFNVSGIVDLPWGFQLGVISSMASRGPITAVVTNVDLDGDGTTTTPLPGLDFNCLNRSCGKSDLAAAVDSWNTTYAGKKDARGQNIPIIGLPSNYSLGDNFSSQDVRATKTFTFKDRWKFSVFAEMFNVFNIANRSGFSYNMNTCTKAGDPTTCSGAFGQATQRVGQVFGSGGPRALQLGARFSF